MNYPAAYFLDCKRSGMYAAPRKLAGFKRAAAGNGVAWYDVDLAGAATKAALLAHCQSAFSFPDGFGHNWDALADSLEDFSWMPPSGYVVLISNADELARRAPADFATALEIFAAAATYWSTKGRLFFVLLDDKSQGGRSLKALDA
jgi:hypothetical protein